MLAALGLTRGVRLLALLGLGAVLVGLASLCVFTVDAGEYAVVTQFGKPVRVESTPGLKFKLRSEEHTSELQSLAYLVCRLLLEKKKKLLDVLHYTFSQNTGVRSKI